MSSTSARSRRLTIFVCLWTWLFINQPLQAQDPKDLFSGLIASGGFILTSEGSIISQLNPDNHYIPASIIKIATSLAALEILGPSYQYQTEFYFKEPSILYIKGFGDPFLTSEFIAEIAGSIKEQNISRIDKIIIDDSTFSTPRRADGSEGTHNPYDVNNGGVVVNFNSLSIQVKSKNHTITSGEDQTPLLNITKTIGSHLEPGLHRVNVSTFPATGSVDNSLRYTGELFGAFLEEEGILVENKIQRGIVDDSAALIYTYTSPIQVKGLVRDCLKFSNNYIANQLLLSCGIALYGYPATWEKGKAALKNILSERFNIAFGDSKIYEGSGLSRRTRVSPRFMYSVLAAFKPYRHLLPEKSNLFIKSGTLTDVYSYAGYFSSPTSTDPFVIILNQANNNRDQVLGLLHDQYSGNLPKNHDETGTM